MLSDNQINTIIKKTIGLTFKLKHNDHKGITSHMVYMVWVNVELCNNIILTQVPLAFDNRFLDIRPYIHIYIYIVYCLLEHTCAAYIDV